MLLLKKLSLGKWLLEAVMLAVVLIYLMPLWMIVTNSLKPTEQANKLAISFPEKFQLDSYVHVIRQSNVIHGLFNGLFLGAVVVIGSVLVSSMASFYMARSKARLARFAYNYFVSGLIIPVAIIPTYFSLLVLHLNNTYTGLIIVFITYTLPLSVFLYAGFMKTIPRELDEAAIIDGSNAFTLFFRIIFPLLGPVTMTIIVFNFIGVWNDVQTYLFFSNGDKWPLPMTVYSFFGKYNQYWNWVFADIVITIAPCLILFIIGQRYIVSGMTAGAVKG